MAPFGGEVITLFAGAGAFGIYEHVFGAAVAAAAGFAVAGYLDGVCDGV